MKKWLALLAVAAVTCGVWWYLRTYVRFQPEWDKAKFGKITRGDIRVPITASGLIDANDRINIKSEASGQVLTIKVVEGDFVKKDDVLVILKKDDEERRLVQAQTALDRANAGLVKSQVAIEQAKQNIVSAESRVEEITANGDIIDIKLKTELDSLEKGFGSNDSVNTLKAQARINAAQLRNARANKEISVNSLKDAEQNVLIQEAAVEEARKSVEEATERLSETTILAPQAAIVTDVLVAEGDLIQSATQSFTGGTPIMMLADVSKLKVVTRVDEADIGRVYQISPLDALPEMPSLEDALRANAELLVGSTGEVTLTVDAFPEDTFKGRIFRVEPQGKLNTGSAIIQYDVHVEVTDDRRFMLPLGTQAQVEFTVESVTDQLMVPAEAVMSFQDERGIWVKVKPEAGSSDVFGKKFIACRFGITDGAHTQIIEAKMEDENKGLKEGIDVFTKLPRERKPEE